MVLPVLASEVVTGIESVEIHPHGNEHCWDCETGHDGKKLSGVRDFAFALGVAPAFVGVSREVRREVLCHQPSEFETDLPWSHGLLTHSVAQPNQQTQRHHFCLIQRLQRWAWVA